jgi:anti-anti-sigma regulatory factor
MLSTQALDPQSDGRIAVYVDLIGDLDATLGDIFAETLVRLTASGATDVFLTTRHVNGSSQSGLAKIDAALATARSSGCSVSIDPGNRRMRTAFASAHIPVAVDLVAARPSHARHLMIARHAPAPTLGKTA